VQTPRLDLLPSKMAFPAALLPAAPSWYPGHMHAFNKMLPSLLSRTDIVLELRDTRMPLTSINPTFESTVARWRADRKMKAGSCCERFIIYGKKDLVSPWGLKVSWCRLLCEEPAAQGGCVPAISTSNTTLASE